MKWRVRKDLRLAAAKVKILTSSISRKENCVKFFIRRRNALYGEFITLYVYIEVTTIITYYPHSSFLRH